MGGQRDAKFYSELKQLNEDLIAYLKASQDKSPYFDFSATLESYIKQAADLLKQYPETSANAGLSRQPTFTLPKPLTTSASPSAPTFNLNPTAASTNSPAIAASSAATSSTQPTASLFSSAFTSSAQPSGTSFSTVFAQPPAPSLSFLPTSSTTTSAATTSATAAATTTTTTTTPFLFGNSTGASSGLSSSFSFVPPPIPKPADLASANQQQQATNDSDDEPHQPPEPKIDKYEEPDAKLALKCKLYERAKNSELNYMATGTFFVKPMDTPDKLQIIIRQEPDLRRVLLNEVVTTSIPVRILPKAVQLAFIDNNGDTKFYIAKVKDEVEAKTLYETLKFNRK